ncbi:restriction endonuclease [Aliamphritea hakodatensis]|uniref:restriction endonuclease n=1 Tax=Aliamphritea hakodatensis TaxID=2895352 RepID=UPI0022FD8BD6|nr:restriction endonuclease [Aliamphritea hakodatensis]
MAIPDFQSCMRPLLVMVEDGAVHNFNETVERVCVYLELTEDEIREKLPSGKQSYIKNRLAWARTYMNKAGLTQAPGRGLIQITPLGFIALKECPQRVDVRYLKQFPAFLEFHQVKSKSDDASNKAVSTATPEVSEKDPQERLDEAFEEIQSSLADELLDMVKQQTPDFLEGLVVQLLQAMGYGGWSESSGAATQYTADGGVDGLINEDPLGLDTIYLQAKRYSDSTVGRPDIQAFVGALEMKRARKGVFITTSQFSSEAKEYCQMIEKKVVLIDGKKLAELMVKYNLGVSTKQSYEVKSIDTDFFSE